eukprot:2999493-Pyramimonas_sp.AAC.1
MSKSYTRYLFHPSSISFPLAILISARSGSYYCPKHPGGIGCSGYLERCCRFSVLNSSCKSATGLACTPNRSRIIRRARLEHLEV